MAGTLARFELREYPCSLCGGSRKRFVRTKPGVIVKENFRLVACETCGHIFVDPRIADEQLASLYDEAYYFGNGFDRTIDYRAADSPSKQAEARNVRETVAAASGEPLKGKKWLEFGCGGGSLLSDLLGQGVDATGFDDSETARGICASKNLPVISKGTLAHLKGTFDVVSALEVIEHVPDPRSFLAFLGSFLKIGGIVFVQTGNWNIVKRIPGTPYLMPEGHIQYFTPAAMRQLFSEVGFEEIHVLNRTWYPVRACPTPFRSFVSPRFFGHLESAVRSIAPQYSQFPIGRKAR